VNIVSSKRVWQSGPAIFVFGVLCGLLSNWNAVLSGSKYALVGIIVFPAIITATALPIGFWAEARKQQLKV
jgi:hypothetical protein